MEGLTRTGSRWLLCIGLSALLVFGCKKEDPYDGNGDNSNSEPETSITFLATKDSLPLQGVLIGITPNQTDRDNGTFLRSGTTGSSGKVTFSDLLSITYYWGASYTGSGGTVERQGSITLEEGDEIEREVKF